MSRRCALVLLLAACGGAGDRGPDPTVAAPQDLYGLRVGARWTYLRSGDVLRWKEITACEDVPLIDIETGEHRVVRAYVRENRGVFGTTSVHYLVADEMGVRRIRRDDVDEGNLAVFTVYEPYSPRLLPGPYHAGDTRTFDLRTAEYEADTESFRGVSTTSAVDTVLGEEDLVVVAGTFRTVGVERQWDANNAHNVQSYYASGVGEVREVTRWPDVPLPRIQIEEVVDYTPGYATCDGTPVDAPCGAPLLTCDDAWGGGAPGCTDPRVDDRNCGACGQDCGGGVCAGGVCLTGSCSGPCYGSTICCPSAWNWGAIGCTNPSRDRWNCGDCGIVCPDGLICDHGECDCAPGTADCGSGCLSVLFDVANCGACGHACGGDTPICDKGVCVSSCLSVDLVACGETCVDPQWDNLNCGACNHACGIGNGTAACRYGACVTCAEAGLADCDGTCADLDWADNNCGTCGHACAAGEVCVFGACAQGDGTCVGPCANDNEICCGGNCADPRTSDHNCGGCGVAQCAGGCTEACRDGVCTPVDCGGGDD